VDGVNAFPKGNIMVQSIRQFYDNTLAALDGDMGHVKDFYFDDKNWVIRYLVADTGAWLTDRLVLLSPHAFGRLEHYEKILHINLHKKQIENSPSIDAHKPVSRQYEKEYYSYYGWPMYWNGDAMWGIGSYPLIIQPSMELIEAQHKVHHRYDKHLQSTDAVTGYTIQTLDGPIGSIVDFLVDDRSWMIHKLVIETGHWYAGKEILISPDKVERISYEESKLFVNVTKEVIMAAPEYHWPILEGEDRGMEDLG
jgi:hypothetical protein